MQRRMVVTDVSEQSIGPIFKGQTVQEEGLLLEFCSDLLFKHLFLIVSHTVD